MRDRLAPLDRPLALHDEALIAACRALERQPCDCCGDGPHGRMVLQRWAWLCRPCWWDVRAGDRFIVLPVERRADRERIWLATSGPDVLQALVLDWLEGA